MSRTVGESVDPRALRAMATLVVLAQLPHLLHLPFWVSVLGLALVSMRVFGAGAGASTIVTLCLRAPMLTGIAIGAAMLVRLDYGYFFGRDPGVALLYILTAARFAEWRRTRHSGFLLCLAGFLLLTHYLYSQTLLSALMTVPTVIALGYALTVLRDPDDDQRPGARFALVARLLCQGLPIAALLFVVFPRLPGPLWSMPDDAVARTGLSDSMAPGSIGTLSRSDAVAFRVDFDGSIPPRSARYWRGPVLERFDGRTWLAGASAPDATVATFDEMPPDAATLDYSITLQPHGRRWLFALDQAIGRPVDWTDDTLPPTLRNATRTRNGELMSGEPVTGALRYPMRSRPSPRFIDAARPHAGYTVRPPRNPRTLELGARIGRVFDTDAKRVAAALAFLGGGDFVYTLRPGVLGDAPVDEFLFDRQAGFCEHYASAFVALMRAADVPARIVTGYLGGEMNGDYMIVRQSDAHAWAEVWIDGTWLRVDPTAAVAPARIASELGRAIDDPASLPMLVRDGRGVWASWRLRWDAVNHQWQRFVIDFDRATQQRLFDRLGLGGLALWQLASVVAVVAAGWVLAVLGLSRGRAARSADVVERTWQRVSVWLEHDGARRKPGEISTDYLRRIAISRPELATSLHALADEFAALRFEPLDDGARLARERRLIAHATALRWRRLRSRAPFGRWRREAQGV